MNNLRTSPLSSCKNLPPPYFFMVHLLHRLYGVDAPDKAANIITKKLQFILCVKCDGSITAKIIKRVILLSIMLTVKRCDGV